MRTLRLGDQGQDVKDWETFLVGQSYYWLEVDGEFDEGVVDATKLFQQANNLKDDGTVGPMTFSVALRLGFPGVSDTAEEENGPNWPPPPDFKPLSPTERETLFGKFSYVPAGIQGNPEAIKITDNWPAQNIVQVDIPQLKGLQGAPASGKIAWHSKGAPQLQALWSAWEAAGLTSLVSSFAGSWAPRFVRGSRTYLSNHAWATAFDINAGYNPLGAVPALVGKPGSVRKLVKLANDYGFFWGGHFSRLDGMHFELAKILDP